MRLNREQPHDIPLTHYVNDPLELDSQEIWCPRFSHTAHKHLNSSVEERK